MIALCDLDSAVYAAGFASQKNKRVKNEDGHCGYSARSRAPESRFEQCAHDHGLGYFKLQGD
jgi:hypothetical protein